MIVSEVLTQNETTRGRGPQFGDGAVFVTFPAQFGADFSGSGENVRRTKGARLGQRGQFCCI